jgi:hydroxymethylpyrimidine pyrophosphatase-like HAD family hydrolase
MSRLKLLSTDFDGTLIKHGANPRCTKAMAEVLMQNKRHGGFWAINTGRSLWHAIEGLDEFHPPVPPDFLLTNEREIFHRTPEGRWVPEHHWNHVCMERHAELFRQAGDLFKKIRAHTAKHPGINLVEEHDEPAGVITSDEAVMEEFAAFLDSERGTHPDFSYQRNTIYLRFSHRDYHKGSALGELSRLLGLGPAEIFAAGDHFNDIPMLDGIYAANTCCPLNAIPEVRETIRRSNGHIASKQAADGVAEAWHFFENAP